MFTPYAAIIAKETRLLLRSRRSFWLLLLALTAAALVFSLFWADSASTFAQADSRTRFSRSAFMVLGLVQLCAMGLITPLMTASSISGEREHKTLDLLYSTAIPRLGLLLGKWLAAIACQIVLLICLLPVYSLVFQFGGVGADEYLFSAAVTAATVATYGMLGLAISIRARRSLRAMLATLGVVMLFNLGIPFILILLVNILHLGLHQFFEAIITAFSPLVLFIICIDSASVPGRLLIPAFILNHAVIFTLATFLAWRGLARGETLKPMVAKKIIDDPALLARRRRRFPFYLVDPLRRAQSIGDRQNPVRVKEHRVGSAGHVDTLIRLGCLGLILSLWPALFTFDGYYNIQVLLPIIAQLALGFALLLVPILSATVITREREEGTLDLLLTTPLSAWGIVRAKFLAVMRSAMILAGSFAFLPCAMLLFVRHEAAFLPALLKALPFVLSFLAFYGALGVYFSSRCLRNATAVVCAYLAGLLCYFAPFLLVVVREAFMNNRASGDGNGVLYFIQAFALSFISPVFSMGHGSTEFSAPYMPEQFWLNVAIRTLLTGVLAALLLRRAARNLARRKEVH